MGRLYADADDFFDRNPHIAEPDTRQCDTCGEPSTLRYLRSEYCDDCAPSEERRFEECSICGKPLDCAELSVPLCARCEGTARAAGQYAADATRFPDPEERR